MVSPSSARRRRGRQEAVIDWGMHTHSGGSPSQCPRRQGLEYRERGCDGSPAHCMPLNNGASLPRQSMLPPGAFLAVELLTPIPSGCLRAAKNSPLPGSTLLTPYFSTQTPPALGDICLKLGHAEL